jgi:radical SAM superfamily enzyme YgiQ (UPF0313 family)
VQKESVDSIMEMCLTHHVKIIGGGPLFTQEYEKYPEIDHFIINEAEITMPAFLSDLSAGNSLKKVYSTNEHADIKKTPIPDFHLLSRKKYAFMSIQVSRGCPYNCDFCEITSLLGHKVRLKTTQQILDELDELYRLKWKSSVFIVDDNFIGNTKFIKNELLPAIKKWMIAHKYPFQFNTQTSINLADDTKLISSMVEAGFSSTFVGIETPDEELLSSCNKVQNKNRDLIGSIKKLQGNGMQVSAGFIVGFDGDSASIFQRQIDFIKKSGIVSAMVGLLNAPKNTALYERLEAENRLTIDATGDNTDFTMNFEPKMNLKELLDGYHNIIQNIYSVKPYYQRIRQFLMHYQKTIKLPYKFEFSHFMAFIKSIFIIGILNKGRKEYWKFLFWLLFNKPNLFMEGLTYVVFGYHYRHVYGIIKN